MYKYLFQLGSLECLYMHVIDTIRLHCIINDHKLCIFILFLAENKSSCRQGCTNPVCAPWWTTQEMQAIRLDVHVVKDGNGWWEKCGNTTGGSENAHKMPRRNALL